MKLLNTFSLAIFYCLYSNFYCEENNILQKAEKTAFSKVSQQLNKINSSRVYFVFGVSYSEIQRNKIPVLTEFHSKLRKKDFIYIMKGNNNKSTNDKTGFSYSQDIPNIAGGQKYTPLNDEQIELMFEYYSNIFTETSIDSANHIKFKINNPLKGKMQQSQSSILGAVNYLTQINTLFDKDWNKSNALYKSKSVFWMHNIHQSLWQHGISKYKENPASYNNNLKDVEFKCINGEKIENYKDDKIASAYEILAKNQDAREMNFILSLVPHYETYKFFIFKENELYFYTSDKNQEFYQFSYNDLPDKDLINNITKLNYMGKIHNIKGIVGQNQKQNTQKPTNIIPLKDFISNVFNTQDVHNTQTNYLTFLALQLQNDNLSSIVRSGEIVESLLNSNEETIYHFNPDNLDSNLFFLFGYHGKMINTTLPYCCYSRSVKDFNRQPNSKNDNISDAEYYNIPTYMDDPQNNNRTMIQQALATLPQTSSLQMNQVGVLLGCMGIFDKWCLMSSIEYMFTLDSQTSLTPINRDISSLYGTLIGSYEIITNKNSASKPTVYIGPSVMIATSRYILNKYVDTLLGFALIVTTLQLLFILKIHYNIYNNTFVITATVGGKTLVYGEEDYLEPEIINRTVKMEILY